MEDSPARSGYRFPRDARLRKRREFLRIQGRGRKIWGQRFIFSIVPGSTERTRLGITVSRKVGNAVRRNRIKRWVREVFRQHPHLFPRPIDVVVTAKRGIEDFSYAATLDEFIHVFTRYYKNPDTSARGGGRRRRRRRSGRRRSTNRQGPGGRGSGSGQAV